MSNIKIGIIGGSGLSDPSLLSVENSRSEVVETPFGATSSPVLLGDICGVPVAVLSRHGRGHCVSPSQVNYRANVFALAQLGCTHVLASTACGSLQQHIEPGSLVLLDQFIDRTSKRPLTFYDGSCSELAGICHMPMAEPFCTRSRDVLIATAAAADIAVHPTGTIVCIEGPRYSTRAESRLFRSWQCDVVSMTTVPEVTLANELGLCYVSLAVVTDFDCWQPDRPCVTVGEVLTTFTHTCDRVVRLFRRTVVALAAADWSDEIARRQKMVKDNIMLPSDV